MAGPFRWRAKFSACTDHRDLDPWSLPYVAGPAVLFDEPVLSTETLRSVTTAAGATRL